jgi:hypothetical protein
MSDPRAAIEALIAALEDAEHTPQVDIATGDTFCAGCSDAAEGAIQWPCLVIGLCPDLVRQGIERGYLNPNPSYPACTRGLGGNVIGAVEP